MRIIEHFGSLSRNFLRFMRLKDKINSLSQNSKMPSQNRVK